MEESRSSSGFTLIELSIVLVIIGLIIGGVLVGQIMIKNATISKAIKQVEQINTAVNTFRGKYKCLPGDCSNAYVFGFTTASNYDSTHNAITTASDVNNGNGDGKIFNSYDGVDFDFEVFNAFWWLHEAGFINVPGVPFNDGSQIDYTNIASALGGSRTAWGATVTNTWSAAYMDTTTEDYINNSIYGVNNEYFQRPGHYHWLAPQGNSANIASGAISPADAFAIDAKIDDGFPRSGAVLASGNDIPDYDSAFNLVPVFAPNVETESGPVGASPSPSSCVASTTGPAYTAPPYVYNVANILGDNGVDNGTNVGAMCTLTVKAGF